jgi:adenine phosphoribosyltransferase
MTTDYRSLIRDIPDFPIPGIMFRDITPLLSDPNAYRAAIEDLAAPFRGKGLDRVAAIEARGYFLGAPLALELGVGFVPIRKSGKLPFETFKATYTLEYGDATIEVHRDGLLAEHRVLLVDDVLATGGTMGATIDLVRQSGATVTGIAVLVELEALNGRLALPEHDIFSLITI